MANHAIDEEEDVKGFKLNKSKECEIYGIDFFNKIVRKKAQY